MRVTWAPVIERAAEIVNSYQTPVTLRQLFYRLVSEQLIPNTLGKYKHLSKLTAEGRRDGTFPDLVDDTRTIEGGDQGWSSPAQAMRSYITAARDQYRRDRTEGQPVRIYVGVEKSGTVRQLREAFDDYDLPVVAVRGFDSQSHIDQVIAAVAADGRPAVLLYLGDYDPSGDDIMRDFAARTGCWETTERVLLTREQVNRYGLPRNLAKPNDSRNGGFLARHGELVQVEMDALPPETLRELTEQAVALHWDDAQYQRVLAREELDVSDLRGWAAELLARVEELDVSDNGGETP